MHFLSLFTPNSHKLVLLSPRQQSKTERAEFREGGYQSQKFKISESVGQTTLTILGWFLRKHFKNLFLVMILNHPKKVTYGSVQRMYLDLSYIRKQRIVQEISEKFLYKKTLLRTSRAKPLNHIPLSLWFKVKFAVQLQELQGLMVWIFVFYFSPSFDILF